MSFPHPTDEELAQLETKCESCNAAVDTWCTDERGGTSPVLHRVRQPVIKKTLQNATVRGKSKVLDAACKDCGHPAAYEVRTTEHMFCSCPLHLFSTIAAMLLGSNVVAVSVINKNAKNADRREYIELAVQAQ